LRNQRLLLQLIGWSACGRHIAPRIPIRNS
jgi:hypothetical protein